MNTTERMKMLNALSAYIEDLKDVAEGISFCFDNLMKAEKREVAEEARALRQEHIDTGSHEGCLCKSCEDQMAWGQLRPSQQRGQPLPKVQMKHPKTKDHSKLKQLEDLKSFRTVLTEQEQIKVRKWFYEGWSIDAIARDVGRHHSTIERFLNSQF